MCIQNIANIFAGFWIRDCWICAKYKINVPRIFPLLQYTVFVIPKVHRDLSERGMCYTSMVYFFIFLLLLLLLSLSYYYYPSPLLVLLHFYSATYSLPLLNLQHFVEILSCSNGRSHILIWLSCVLHWLCNGFVLSRDIYFAKNK